MGVVVKPYRGLPRSKEGYWDQGAKKLNFSVRTPCEQG